MEATVRWYVGQGLVERPLPRLAAEASGTAGPSEEPARADDSLFEPPSGREREPSP